MRPREVTFILEKEAEISWERLLATSQRQPWLRVDFKNWRDEDDSDGDDDPIIGIKLYYYPRFISIVFDLEKLLDDLNALSSEDEDEENDWEDLDEDEESYSYSDEDDSEDTEAADYDWRQDENCHGEELAGKIVARNIARVKQKMKMLNNLTPAQVERLNNVDLGEDTSGEAFLGALLGSGEEYQEALSLYRHSEMECGADCPHCQESMDLLTADMMRTLRLEDREKYEEMMKTIKDKPRSL